MNTNIQETKPSDVPGGRDPNEHEWRENAGAQMLLCAGLGKDTEEPQLLQL